MESQEPHVCDITSNCSPNLCSCCRLWSIYWMRKNFNAVLFPTNSSIVTVNNLKSVITFRMHLCTGLALGCKYSTFSWSAGMNLPLNSTETCNIIYQWLLSVPFSLLWPWSTLLMRLSVVSSRCILFVQMSVEGKHIYSWRCNLKCI